MKKMIALVIAAVCMLSMGGCQKAISGSEVFSFPEPTIQVKVTFYSQGTTNEFTIGSEKYDPDDLSVIPIIEWFYNLELKECEDPEAVEGSETYSFVVGDESFFYDNRGNTAFVFVNDKWFEVQNPTVPPINFDSLTPNGEKEQTTPNTPNATIPSIMYEGNLYRTTGKQMAGEVDETAIVGNISSVVPLSQFPANEGEANFGQVGDPYALTVDGLVILLNNEWTLFELLAEE